MAVVAGVNLSSPSPRVMAAVADSPQRAQAMIKFPLKLNQKWPTKLVGSGRGMNIQVVRAAPEKISDKVEKSIKEAEETCSENPAGAECAAAWDEVEELSAAASHARDKKKGSDPLEDFCKDNPETDECRTYED